MSIISRHLFDPKCIKPFQDYLEKYKKYLNLKRDAVLQKHGSQYSVNSMGIGQPKVSPSAATAPLSMN